MLSRRSFFAFLFGAIGIGRTLWAGAKEKISETDPTPKALGYKHDAAKVDLAKFPAAKNAVKSGSVCKACTFYKADATEPGWGECTLFSRKLVAEGGWCMSFAKKR